MAEITFESTRGEVGLELTYFVVTLYLDPLKYRVEDAVENIQFLCSFYPEAKYNYGECGTYQVAYPSYLPNFDHLLIGLLKIEKTGRNNRR